METMILFSIALVGLGLLILTEAHKKGWLAGWLLVSAGVSLGFAGGLMALTQGLVG